MRELFDKASEYFPLIPISMGFLMTMFMAFQATKSQKLRPHYVMFSISWATLMAVEILWHTGILKDYKYYELLRLGHQLLYALSIMGLFGVSNKKRTIAGVLLLALSVGMWLYNMLATTSVVFFFTFGTGVVFHARHYLKHRGFASIVLTATSLAFAITCTRFYDVFMYHLEINSVRPMMMGYMFYAVLLVFSIFLGWQNFPRELETNTFVPVSLRTGVTLVSVVGICAFAALYDLSNGGGHTVYKISILVIVVAFMALHMRHKDKLVIHTANNQLLLEEVTKTLREKEALVAEQKTNLEVIMRLKRLEPAASVAAQVSHDLKNLISPTLKWVKDLESEVSNPSIKSITGKMKNQLGSMIELSDNMLAQSRRTSLDSSPIDIVSIVNDVTDDDNLAGINFQINIDPSIWPIGSGTQMKRIVSCLVSNARDSYEDKIGNIRITSKKVTFKEKHYCFLGVLDPGVYAQISVMDEGCGIKKNLQEEVFKEGVTTKSSSGRGSGLGLVNVKNLTEDMGGVVDMNTSSAGTAFVLYFPNFIGKENLENYRGDETVLLVDDNEVQLDKTAQILEEAGYTVNTMTSGSDAIHEVNSAEHFDLAILDYDMPGRNGRDTLFGMMNVNATGKGIKAIVYTSYVDLHVKADLLRLGVYDVVDKACPKMELLRIVRYALDDKIEDTTKL